MQKLKTILYFIIAATIFLISGCSKPENSGSSETDITNDYGIMEVEFFGNADSEAMIIMTENHTVMIDTGSEEEGIKLLNYLWNRSIYMVDYLIITHFDMDHVGGAAEIIKKMDVNEIMIPNYDKKSIQYDSFKKRMNKEDINPTSLTDTVRFTLDGVEFVIYPAQKEYKDYTENNNDDNDENNFSLAISIKHGNKNFLFTGDAMAERLSELLDEKEIKKTNYDLLKVPHHGKYNKNSKKFISKIAPKYAVIICSLSVPPDERIITALNKAGTEIFSTENGNVYCKSDGNTLSLEYK